MGQSHSTEGRHKMRRPSFRYLAIGSISKRRANSSKNLSHTFSFPDETLKPQQLNINTATEEELMTLPGITRNIAVNIVSHRRLIGRFNRIEDVALVSGVGAQKLENIKSEVYVASVNGSGTSSRASTTLDSMGNTESPVDVNLASVFDLQTLPGVDQELASRIVEKRTKHGCYHSLDELAKLRGMGKHRFAMIKPHLKINLTNGLVIRTPSNDSSSLTWDIPQASSTPRLNNIGRKNGRVTQDEFTEPILPADDNDKHFELSTGISEKEIWELLSIASPRPSVRFDGFHKSFDRSTIRIASWNLTNFTADKASNPGVMEVICRTILENKISLLALQEVKSVEALDILTSELNTPTLKRVRDWRENRRKWYSVHLGAGLAVLWDGNPKKNITLREQPPATKVFLPALASMIFHINKIHLTIINVQMHGPDDTKIIERFIDAKNAIFLGDFSWTDDLINGSGNNIMMDTNTAINSEKYFYKDRIIWREDATELFDTGLHRVVREGLMHLGIPQGWRWGGPASDHCPVWCEIFTESGDT